MEKINVLDTIFITTTGENIVQEHPKYMCKKHNVNVLDEGVMT